ncbi:hypothetical protein N9A80_02050 [Rhodopirellula sp.]|nr:hypothetical protein [Rhodopirellula sp.]MDA7914634.1 hypothetical protein [bacterium]MDB4445885.1 hypothetical protein [bacterium]MDB4561477.1 hypothetical protein [bacterium]
MGRSLRVSRTSTGLMGCGNHSALEAYRRVGKDQRGLSEGGKHEKEMVLF